MDAMREDCNVDLKSPEGFRFFYSHLWQLRYCCIDDLPEERVTMDDPRYYDYKCRKNWWTAVLAWIEMVWDCEVKDLELILLMSQFDRFARNLDFSVFREEWDIKKANLFLDKILEKMRLMVA